MIETFIRYDGYLSDFPTNHGQPLHVPYGPKDNKPQSAEFFLEARFIELDSHLEAEMRSFDCCLLIV